jgi:hypothetical protein
VPRKYSGAKGIRRLVDNLENNIKMDLEENG